ncbi:MAG: class I SAM-dependent methyltransferase [Clostridium sp.]|uniref:class I SAM-dependent methyltransferase n=1 Tax=Clostridium sp. TaxID=1506 RepID=UPI0029118A25|nr:class I SAM-dependent methyltransferase [Clostridium sp.]MDU5110599.1 class I SAM-dependent methyltransferase [Clostridium sp.]
MNNTEKFTGKASVYSEARPSYPKALFDYLVNVEKISKDSIIADIGSGTGKFSESLLNLGFKVFAVEPNKDMRTKAENLLSLNSSFISINGTDSNTTLKDNSIDYITVAQAFHWFNPIAFKKECQRILKEKGKVILVWNNRVPESEIVIKNAEICKKYCKNFKGFSGGFDIKSNSISEFFNNKYDLIKFENNLKYDEDKFIKRILSSSYSLTDGDENYLEYINALKDFFKDYSINGILTIPNETIMYIGNVF